MTVLHQLGASVIPEISRALRHREVVEDTRMLWRILDLLGSMGAEAKEALPALRQIPRNDDEVAQIVDKAISTIDGAA